ncbi:hypothetical protein QJV45_03530 [Listeria booriae]|uniref:hypothetical protein n=1 Tax=Listeria booriae TaxID=1552123 RepID=UPI00288059DC|nr:hypothetical protein [Listeria booriae]MDT0109517.1 hypothetical protein [Listeria booriae]
MQKNEVNLPSFFQPFGNSTPSEKVKRRLVLARLFLFNNGMVGSEVCAIACMVSLFCDRVFYERHCMIGTTLSWLPASTASPSELSQPPQNPKEGFYCACSKLFQG